VIAGKGMPVKGKAGQRGDLVVKFDIQFPQELSFTNKARVVELLRNSE
jgi:DnaJ-class molecular chaperone